MESIHKSQVPFCRYFATSTAKYLHTIINMVSSKYLGYHTYLQIETSHLPKYTSKIKYHWMSLLVTDRYLLCLQHLKLLALLCSCSNWSLVKYLSFVFLQHLRFEYLVRLINIHARIISVLHLQRDQSASSDSTFAFAEAGSTFVSRPISRAGY